MGSMTPNEAIAIVDEKAKGRTRYEDRHDFLDEVLVAEIKRLRKEVEDLEEAEKVFNSDDWEDDWDYYDDPWEDHD